MRLKRSEEISVQNLRTSPPMCSYCQRSWSWSWSWSTHLLLLLLLQEVLAGKEGRKEADSCRSPPGSRRPQTACWRITGGSGRSRLMQTVVRTVPSPPGKLLALILGLLLNLSQAWKPQTSISHGQSATSFFSNPSPSRSSTFFSQLT